ncbi:MAG TPA: DUF3303 family protein [Thermoanaerobaculia bacterium]
MLYMVLEHFRANDPRPVYKRFAERGRMLPDDVKYVSSWIDTGLTRCFQLMEAPDAASLEEWMSRWRDIVDFEYCEVISSAEAAARTAKLP